jgi:SAM-dependent methyltransferase
VLERRTLQTQRYPFVERMDSQGCGGDPRSCHRIAAREDACGCAGAGIRALSPRGTGGGEQQPEARGRQSTIDHLHRSATSRPRECRSDHQLSDEPCHQLAHRWTAQSSRANIECMTPPSNHDSDGRSKAHWDAVYTSKSPNELSWYQSRPTRSLEILGQLGAGPASAIIDVGGGASTLVDALLDRGANNVSVLDISRAALAQAQERLGARAASVTWIEADITSTDLPEHAYDVWHDRAVYHFLTSAKDRRRYAHVAAHALRPGGAAIIATFASHGPTRCSGLDVVRYDSEQLARELGQAFSLDRSIDELHHTPSGIAQAFTYTVLRRL